MLIAALFYNKQKTEEPWVSINRVMDKKDAVHIYIGMLLSHKKNEIMLSAAAWMT